MNDKVIYRLAHYIYQTQSRRAISSDDSAVIHYLDGISDTEFITKDERKELLALANEVHRNRLKHQEPFEKIPYKSIVESICKILGVFTEDLINKEIHRVYEKIIPCHQCDKKPRVEVSYTGKGLLKKYIHYIAYCPDCKTGIVEGKTADTVIFEWMSRNCKIREKQ